MKHLIRLALVALFITPFSLSAERSIMDPVVYDLRGALTQGYEVAAVVTDAGELSEFTFDTASSYLTETFDPPRTRCPFYHPVFSQRRTFHYGPRNL